MVSDSGSALPQHARLDGIGSGVPPLDVDPFDVQCLREPHALQNFCAIPEGRTER